MPIFYFIIKKQLPQLLLFTLYLPLFITMTVNNLPLHTGNVPNNQQLHIVNLGTQIINTLHQLELADNIDLVQHYQSKVYNLLRNFHYTIITEPNITTIQKQTLLDNMQNVVFNILQRIENNLNN